jgi:rhodanese-related sulfurtransferase
VFTWFGFCGRFEFRDQRNLAIPPSVSFVWDELLPQYYCVNMRSYGIQPTTLELHTELLQELGGFSVPIRRVFEHIREIAETIENLDVEDLKRELAEGGDLVLLDLREIQELVDKGTIPGAKHVPRGMLEFWADPASPYARDFFGETKRTIVFCAAGSRSVYAVKALEDMGYTNVAHLASGFGGWESAGEPIHDFSATSRWVRRDQG